MFYSMFAGYAVFYFCRKNISAALPAMSQALGYTNTQLGVLGSVLYATYGFGKFFNGVLADKANIRFFMAFGLLLSAIMNIFFGLSTSLTMLGIFWGLSGWFQSMGFPPVAKGLTNWYSTSERATWWAFWSVSHQVGGGFILILSGFLAQHYGWRASFFGPALIGIAMSLFLINRLRDTPTSLGLPPVEEYRNDYPDGKPLEREPGAPRERLRDVLWEHVLTNPYVWVLSFAYIFVYLVRYGTLDWAAKFLVEQKGYGIGQAGLNSSLLELVGIAGTILAGWVSDKYYKGKRGPISVIFLVLLAGAAYALLVIPPGHKVLDGLALASIGFFTYGPQMLVGGVWVADVASKRAAAAATGFAGAFGYIGAILSGAGSGYMIDHFGWSGGFYLWIAGALIAALLCATMWNVKSRVKK